MDDFSDQVQTVALGAGTYDLTPQPLPYLKRKLGAFFEDLTEAGIDASNIADVVTGRAHELLSVFIPDLMPLHVWEGYRSEEDMAADNYDEGFARKEAPTGPQVKLAVTAGFKVNGLDLWKSLGKLVDPTMLQGFLGRMLEGEDVLAGLRSQTSSTTSTDSTSTPSGMTTDPILEGEGLTVAASG